MSEKKIKSRIVHKTDVEANWKKAVSFTPIKGELIIYSPDTTYSYSRFKIGDGVTNVNSLPFTDGFGGTGVIDAGPIIES